MPAKSRYIKIFRYIAKFRYIANFRYVSEISLHSEIFTCSEISVPLFCVQTTPFLDFSISTLTVIILFRIDWYFHLFIRLYKPFYEQFVTELFIQGISITGPYFWPSFALFSLFFLSLSRQPNTPLEDDNSKYVWIKPLNLEEEGF